MLEEGGHDVDDVELALGADGQGQGLEEGPGAGTDVGDDHARLQLEGSDDLVAVGDDLAALALEGIRPGLHGTVGEVLVVDAGANADLVPVRLGLVPVLVPGVGRGAGRGGGLAGEQRGKEQGQQDRRGRTGAHGWRAYKIDRRGRA